MNWYYVFQIERDFVDERGLGPTYRLVAGQSEVGDSLPYDGAWHAKDETDAMEQAAARLKVHPYDSFWIVVPAQAMSYGPVFTPVQGLA
jgi:hypothetical protein